MVQPKAANQERIAQQKDALKTFITDERDALPVPGGPQQPRAEQTQRVQSKEQGVQPMLARLAMLPMHRFIFGYEQTRKDAQPYVNAERGRARRDPKQPAVTEQHRQGIERMSDALPARQLALPVKIELIQRHTQHLRGDRNE